MLVALLLLGAALAGAAELPYGGWIQIPILALVWWCLDTSKAISFKNSFLLGWIFGLGYFIIGLWWLYISLHDIGGMNSALSCVAVFLLSSYVALYFSAASLSIRLFRSSAFSGVLLASSWVVFEYLRGEIFTGFPWMGFAESQVNGPFAAIAPYLGGLGCTFFAVLAAWLLFCIKKESAKNAVGLLFVLAIPLLAGQSSFTKPTGEPLSVQLIQGNFAQSLILRPEGIVQQIDFYNRAITSSNAELTIAPETAFPWPESSLPPDLFLGLQKFTDTGNGNLLFGTIGRDPYGENGREFSNRALGISPKTQRYEYDKNHLVPFGRQTEGEILILNFGQGEDKTTIFDKDVTPVRGRDRHIGDFSPVARPKMELSLPHELFILLQQQIKQPVLLLLVHPVRIPGLKLFPGFCGPKTGMDCDPIG